MSLSVSRQFDMNPRALFGALALLNILLFFLSLGIGYTSFDLSGAIMDWINHRQTLPALIFFELRLPRAVLGVCIGFTLGLAGAAMQGYLRNPLAEPGVMGVSGAASFGAVIMFYSGAANVFALATPIGGIGAALLAILALQALAGRGASVTTLVLAGVALNSIAAALTALMLNLSPNPYAALEIMFWLMGSLADRSHAHLLIALPFMFVGWALILPCGRGLDALILGEDTARTLGINLKRLRWQLVIGTALCVGSAVAVAGAIGFVGLVVPHLMRPFVGCQPGRLLLSSAMAGSALTLLADVSVRLIGTLPELQLGVVTALVGAPFLFALIASSRRSQTDA